MSSKIGEYIRAHVLGLLAVLIALSGTAVAGQRTTSGEGLKASASVVTDAKFKKLKKRVAALERKAPPTIPTIPTIPTTLPPSGGAGGDLTGVYPNPQIGPGAVGAAEIGPGAVTNNKFFHARAIGTNVAAVAGETCVNAFSSSVPGIELGDQVVVTPPAGFPQTFTLTGVPDPAAAQVHMRICNHFTGGGAADPDGMGGTYGLLVIEHGL